MQIYLITNNITRQNYVGQAKWDFQTRYNGNWHKWTHNKYLKRSANKYKPENFTVKILEDNVPSEEWMDDLEDYYIKKYNCIYPLGYNFQTGGHKNYIKPYFAKEYQLKDHNNNIHQIINLSQFCKLNKLNYSAMLNMVSGLNYSSQGYALSSTPTDLIINPNEEWELEKISTKEIYKVSRKNLQTFSKEMNLNIDLIQTLLRKETYVSQGFKLKETIIDGIKIKEKKQKYENIKFIDPNGKEVIINNIYQFCKEHPILDRKGFYDLIKGYALMYAGWRLPCEEKEFKERKELRLGKIIKIKNIKTKEIIEIKNISKFCRDNSIPLNLFNSMISGAIKQFLNFCLPETDLTDYKYPKKIIYIKMIDPNGKIIEGKNPKEIQKNNKISSQNIYDAIAGREKLKLGWKIIKVKYLNGYYPEINIE